MLTLLLALAGCRDYGLAYTNPSEDTGAVRAQSGDAATSDDAPTQAPLSGHAWAVLPSALHFTDPPGVGGVLSAYLDNALLFYVAEQTPTALAFQVALGTSGGAQDPCERLVDLPAADWSNPHFDLGPADFATTLGGHPVTFYGFQITGTWSSDGTSWNDGVIGALLDAREVDAALPEGLSLCALVEDAGGACVSCPDGAQQCVALTADDVFAVQIDGFTSSSDRSGC